MSSAAFFSSGPKRTSVLIAVLCLIIAGMVFLIGGQQSEIGELRDRVRELEHR